MTTALALVLGGLAVGALYRIGTMMMRTMVGISVLCEAQIAWLRHANEPEELAADADRILLMLAVMSGDDAAIAKYKAEHPEEGSS
jgi:hypothetical protein